MKLTAENVDNLFKQCLCESGNTFHGKIVHAKLNTEGREEIIHSLLIQLPEEFHESKGKGWNFSSANIKKENIVYKNPNSMKWENLYTLDWDKSSTLEWTTSPVLVEKLILLGIAAKKAKYITLKGLWQNLPGEMPYIVVLDGVDKSETVDMKA
jgi:hypothetical protein